MKYFGKMTLLSRGPITITEKHAAMLGFLDRLANQLSVLNLGREPTNTNVMCSEYVSTDASMVYFALQPKGKGKLKSSQMFLQALDLHAFCMLCSFAVVWVSSWAQEEPRLSDF